MDSACTSDNNFIHVAAPMVRYSKLSFRKLIRNYNVDVSHTPMIIASSFVRSNDHPLIVQFAANNPTDLADAAQIVAPFCQGVDLNCGCPQKWAMKEGLGSHLINQPDLVAQMCKETRARLPTNDALSLSIKIRLTDDIAHTVDLCTKAESAGIDRLTVHGRTPRQRNEPLDYDAVRLIKQSVHIPVILNGDICTLDDAKMARHKTGVDGVMTARGLLNNPTLFTGTNFTSKECIALWVHTALRHGLHFGLFHHHLMFMLERHLSKAERRVFNRLFSVTAVLDYLTIQELM